MNIYEKVQRVKQKLLEANIKKSGLNKYAGYNYYELSDFTPHIVNECNEIGLFTSISFNKEVATLKIINTEKPEEVLEYTSPMEDLELKGCNKVQALGGVETYSRRYLYMSAFDIIENDMFDAGKDEDAKNEAEKIDEVKIKALNQAFDNKKYTPDQIINGLKYFGYEKVEDIKVKDYMKIYNAVIK